MSRLFIYLIVCSVLLSHLSMAAYADLFEDVGMNRLQEEMGTELPAADCIPVSQIEGASNGHWMPDTADPQLAGKSIINVNADMGSSGHATSVARLFYGNSSALAHDIDSIRVYYASDWMQTSYLGALGWGGQPFAVAEQVANHSWVSTLPSQFSLDILSRVDWVVETDEFIQVAALANGSANQELLSHAYNVIAVGRTDANHPLDTVEVGGIYVAGRTLPTLVTPMGSTSSATPVVASAAALLVAEGGQYPSLSTDPVERFTDNRYGGLIYNAQRSEVIKAALMSGADRFTRNTGAYGDIRDYRSLSEDCSANGLDSRYGAGQLNIYNSFQIISAGEQNPIEDDSASLGMVGHAGFDYDPAFGGSGESNFVSSYFVTADEMHSLLQVSLVWNLDIHGGSYFQFDNTAALYNLDLVVYDLSDNGRIVASSMSSGENTENIVAALIPGHEYLIQVKPGDGQEPFLRDYALAWIVRPDQDGDRIPDEMDNCMLTANNSQLDTDDDGYGNICDCDYNNDGIVNMIDYVFFKKQYMTEGENDADANGDQIVNMIDYVTFKKRYQTTAPYY